MADKLVIDPAVVFFNSGWHYTAPVGAPQEGAHHYVSPDGLHFSAVPVIPSDNMHNWTGNLMVNNGNEMRFYGSGPSVWYNSTDNGVAWKGFVNTNVKGGDPSVIQLADGSYIMIYVGKPNAVATNNELNSYNIPVIYPNPATTQIRLLTKEILEKSFSIYSIDGSLIKQGLLQYGIEIRIEDLLIGSYLLVLKTTNGNQIFLKFEKVLGF